MLQIDEQYLALLCTVLKEGIVQQNRTGIGAQFIPGAMLQSDLREGFPILSSKPISQKACFGEMLGFIRGYSNAADFRKLGCSIWDQNANENQQWLASPFRKGVDDLGRIYGSVWRSREAFVSASDAQERTGAHDLGYEFRGYAGNWAILSKEVDQFHDVIDAILNRPYDRRIIMHAWFPEVFQAAALPPCHTLYQFIPDVQNKVLHMSMYQRSCDLLLGVPFNHAGGAFLLSLIAEACGYEAGIYSHHMANVHLYANQVEAARIHLDRADQVFKSPTMFIDRERPSGGVRSTLRWLESFDHSNYRLYEYEPLESLPRVAMAV